MDIWTFTATAIAFTAFIDTIAVTAIIAATTTAAVTAIIASTATTATIAVSVCFTFSGLSLAVQVRRRRKLTACYTRRRVVSCLYLEGNGDHNSYGRKGDGGAMPCLQRDVLAMRRLNLIASHASCCVLCPLPRRLMATTTATVARVMAAQCHRFAARRACKALAQVDCLLYQPLCRVLSLPRRLIATTTATVARVMAVQGHGLAVGRVCKAAAQVGYLLCQPP